MLANSATNAASSFVWFYFSPRFVVIQELECNRWLCWNGLFVNVEQAKMPSDHDVLTILAWAWLPKSYSSTLNLLL